MPSFSVEEWYDGLYLKPAHARGFTRQLADKTTRVLYSDDSLRIKHNTYTLYVVSLLLWGTAHRPVRDPFAFRKHLSLRSGLALICDKVTDIDRAFRLVPLCPLLVEQIEHYFAHLQSLINRWHNGNESEQRLARTCALILQGKPTPSPVFFLIDERHRTHSILENDVELFWQDIMPLPPNFGRSNLATHLLFQGVEQEDILALLGHSVSPEHWCGANAQVSALQVMDRLRDAIQMLLLSLGWQALPGLKFYAKDPMKRSFSRVKSAIHAGTLLGPDRRAYDREKRLDKARRIVVDYATSLGLTETNTAITLDSGTALLDKIKGHKGGENLPLHRALALWLAEQAKAGRDIPPLSLVIDIPSEPSPFKSDSLIQYEDALDARHKLLTWLKEAYKDDRLDSKETRIGALICCAALFGDCHTADHLSAIAHSLSTQTYCTESIVHIELYSRKNSPHKKKSEKTQEWVWVGRWLPDKLSLSLLASVLTNPVTGMDGHTLNQTVSHILSAVGLTPFRGGPLSRLAELGQAAAAIERPGYLSRGQQTGYLSPLAWGRLLTNKIPADVMYTLDDDQQGSKKLEGREAWLPNLSKPGQTASGQRFKRALQRIFNEIHTLNEAGEFSGQKKANKALAQQIRQLTDSMDDLPIVVRLIASWAYRLCLKGTPGTEEPATSTLEKYIFLVLNGLLDSVGDADFTAFTDEEYEETYWNALDVGKQADQVQLTGQLQSFHSFLVDKLSVEECHWGALWSLTRRKVGTVSADIVTRQEFDRALDWILSDPTLQARERYQYATMLILGYRFGIRFGEAYRLRHLDIQHSPDWTIVYIIIRNTVFGKTKTEAGVRQVALLEQLTDREIKALQNVVAMSATAAEDDIQAGLMAQSASQRTLIDRSRLSQYLNAVLKQVSGSGYVRFHHLRHSYVSRVHAAIVAQSNPECVPVTAQIWLREPVDLSPLTADDRFPHALKSLPVNIGHASLSTTVRFYTHSRDLHIKPGDIAFDTLKDIEIAHLLDAPYNTFKKRKKSLGSDHDPVAFAVARKKLPSITEEGYQDYVPLERPDSDSLLTDAKVTPAIIEQVLHRIGSRYGSTTGLAEGFLLTDQQLKQIIDIAERLERRSGYEEYLTFSAIEDPHYALLKAQGFQKRQKHQEHRRLQALLQDQESLYQSWGRDERQAIRGQLERCEQYLNPVRKRSVVVTRYDLDCFTSLLDALGFSADLILEGTPQINSRQVLETYSHSRNITVRIRKNPARSMERSVYRRKIGTALSIENLPASIGNQRTLYRLFFVLCVWLTLVDCSEAN